MSKYETPNYKLVKEEDNFQLREYDNFYIVEYRSKKDPNIKGGFQTLFKYISSDNKQNEKISMTVPVIQHKKEKVNKMAFVLPKKYWDNIPKPNNKNLEVKKFEKGLYATISFSGYSNSKKEEKYKTLLKKKVNSENLKIESEFMLAAYNAPFKPLFRKNEIWVKVSKK